MTDELDRIIELAGRQVETQAGVKKYGLPIGAWITDEQSNASTQAKAQDPNNQNKVNPGLPERQVTVERLTSVSRILRAAQRIDNKSAIRGAFHMLLQTIDKFADERNLDPRTRKLLVQQLSRKEKR